MNRHVATMPIAFVLPVVFAVAAVLATTFSQRTAGWLAVAADLSVATLAALNPTLGADTPEYLAYFEQFGPEDWPLATPFPEPGLALLAGAARALGLPGVATVAALKGVGVLALFAWYRRMGNERRILFAFLSLTLFSLMLYFSTLRQYLAFVAFALAAGDASPRSRRFLAAALLGAAFHFSFVLLAGAVAMLRMRSVMLRTVIVLLISAPTAWYAQAYAALFLLMPTFFFRDAIGYAGFVVMAVLVVVLARGMRLRGAYSAAVALPLLAPILLRLSHHALLLGGEARGTGPRTHVHDEVHTSVRTDLRATPGWTVALALLLALGVQRGVDYLARDLEQSREMSTGALPLVQATVLP